MRYQLYLRNRSSASFRKATTENIGKGNITMDTPVNYKKHNAKKKVKRFRSAFTTDQVNYLEKKYKKCPYISYDQRKEIATELNISERAIKIWYQNRRMKEKREGGGQEFEDEQIRYAEYTKYSKRLANNVTKSSNDETSQERIITNEKMSDDNVIPNGSTSGTEQMNQCFNSEFVQNKVATTKIDNTATDTLDAVSTESKTLAEQSLDVREENHAENLSTTVKNEQLSQMELEKSRENLSINTTQQTGPENLTFDNKTNEPVAVPEAVSNNPGLTSVPTDPSFNSQFYVPMVWNQNGVPVPPGAPSTSIVNIVPSSQDNIPIKRCWHCDPNIRQLMSQVSYFFPQHDSNVQYFITAVAIQPPSTKS